MEKKIKQEERQFFNTFHRQSSEETQTRSSEVLMARDVPAWVVARHVLMLTVRMTRIMMQVVNSRKKMYLNGVLSYSSIQ